MNVGVLRLVSWRMQYITIKGKPWADYSGILKVSGQQRDLLECNNWLGLWLVAFVSLHELKKSVLDSRAIKFKDKSILKLFRAHTNYLRAHAHWLNFTRVMRKHWPGSHVRWRKITHDCYWHSLLTSERPCWTCISRCCYFHGILLLYTAWRVGLLYLW